MPDDEISLWIQRLQIGDERAPELIWHQYFEKLVRLARKRMGDLPRRATDDEDVALSAMNSLFRGVEAGRFPRLADRDDLWKVLVTITARKAIKYQRRHFAAKRGGGRVRGNSLFDRGTDSSRSADGFEQILGREPSPELAEQVSEACRELIDKLDDDTLATIACYKLEGYSSREIADKLKCTKRTVERKLERIRNIWIRH